MRFIDDLPYDSPGGTRFQLPPVTRESVLQTIKDFRSDCSTGVDQLPTRFIRISAEYLTVPLKSIISNCIEKAHFPKLWKVAQVSPVSNKDRQPSLKWSTSAHLSSTCSLESLREACGVSNGGIRRQRSSSSRSNLESPQRTFHHYSSAGNQR